MGAGRRRRRLAGEVRNLGGYRGGGRWSSEWGARKVPAKSPGPGFGLQASGFGPGGRTSGADRVGQLGGGQTRRVQVDGVPQCSSRGRSGLFCPRTSEDCALDLAWRVGSSGRPTPEARSRRLYRDPGGARGGSIQDRIVGSFRAHAHAHAPARLRCPNRARAREPGERTRRRWRSEPTQTRGLAEKRPEPPIDPAQPPRSTAQRPKWPPDPAQTSRMTA